MLDISLDFYAERSVCSELQGAVAWHPASSYCPAPPRGSRQWQHMMLSLITGGADGHQQSEVKIQEARRNSVSKL
jgi:hypothetical protein